MLLTRVFLIVTGQRIEFATWNVSFFRLERAWLVHRMFDVIMPDNSVCETPASPLIRTHLCVVSSANGAVFVCKE